MRMRYPRHLNMGPVDSPEESCELVKWCQVSQPGTQRGGLRGTISRAPNHYGGAEWLREAPKSPNNVASTFFNTVHLLPTSDANMGRAFACDLRFEEASGSKQGTPNLLLAPGAI